MADLPPILTSNSAYSLWHKCQRARWLAYEASNGTPTRGWERQRLSMPLSTGGWCHRVAQGLFLLALGGDLTHWEAEVGVDPHQAPTNASEVIQQALAGYRSEALERGLDLGLTMDGQIEEERFVQRTIAEQSALLEAFGWSFVRVRLPKILAEYELVDVEREEYTLLSGDVGLHSRCDAVLRRRSDQRLFIYNLKTTSSPDKRWHDQWEVDGQLMTETLAIERRLQERVYGVLIDGFDKGPRVEVDWETLKERPKAEAQKWQAQRSRLIYGYKCEDIPGRPTLYDYEGTTRKGWGKFAVWEEDFGLDKISHTTAAFLGQSLSPVAYWINWLPQEQVEAAFVSLPPIMRSDRALGSVVRQMVSVEKRIHEQRDCMEPNPQEHQGFFQAQMDDFWPQNFHSCTYPSRCQFYGLCHVDGAIDDPASHGFQPRQLNHPALEGE